MSTTRHGLRLVALPGRSVHAQRIGDHYTLCGRIVEDSGDREGWDCSICARALGLAANHRTPIRDVLEGKVPSS